MNTSLHITSGQGQLIFYEDGPPDSFSSKCTVLQSNRSILVLSGKFEGIPDNLTINVVTWVILLIIFTFLRKKAWDYGRIALVQKKNPRWMQLFYGELNTEEIDPAEADMRMDKGALSWIKAVFTLKDDHILKRNGHDAITYLSFQRHLIFLLCLISIISSAVILPINLQGNLVDDENKFGRTTLSNLDPSSSFLWMHVACSFLFLIIGIFIMKRFTRNIQVSQNESLVNRTLIISKVSKDSCEESTLKRYFSHTHTDCVVENVYIAYNVRYILDLDAKRETATHAKIYCESIFARSGARPQMRPYICGQICCCGCCKQIDALNFYTQEENDLAIQVERNRSVSLLQPVGVVFITLESEDMAERLYKYYKKIVRSDFQSSYARELNVRQWQVRFAPPPEDLLWQNVSIDTKFWLSRSILTNFVLFILFVFLTTPTIILRYMDILKIHSVKTFVRETGVAKDFFSTLVLLLFSSLLPIIVSYSNRFMPHWTRSSRNHSEMIRIFVFLLFMVVILPLLQLTSVKALLEWSIRKGETYRWQCVFLSENGAFFVNYVITASFIGTALDLIRFPELFMYTLYICTSRSRAEQVGLRKAIMREFEFGVQYAYILLIFAVVIIYSVVCPIITPFGVVYMVLKHLVDRYNMYFVYSPSKISRNIQETAISFVVISIILMQICVLFFLYLRNGWMGMSIASLVICLVTVMIFIGQISFQWFRVLCPISYKAFSRRMSSNEPGPSNASPQNTQQPYLPLVLKQSYQISEIFATGQDMSYGTNEDSVNTTPDAEMNLPYFSFAEQQPPADPLGSLEGRNF